MSCPFPSLLLIHTLASPIQPGPDSGGKSDLFCRGEFLGEIVKALTVGAFISVERRGRKEKEMEMEGSRGGEFGHSRPC